MRSAPAQSVVHVITEEVLDILRTLLPPAAELQVADDEAAVTVVEVTPLQQLGAMGFERALAQTALVETNGTLETAVALLCA